MPMPARMPPGPTSTSLDRLMSPFTFSGPPAMLVSPLKLAVLATVSVP